MLPPDTALILIAVMTQPRDLDIARLLGWYRIPLKFAPKVVDVDYLAFYQTSGFGADLRWQIMHYAAVRGHELTTRAELLKSEAGHPRADEEYYKIQLGAVERLAEPIQAGRWRRVTFLYTTGDLFRSARTINDLVVKPEAREILWRALRERAQNAADNGAAEVPDDFLDAALQAMLGDFGKLAETQAEYID